MLGEFNHPAHNAHPGRPARATTGSEDPATRLVTCIYESSAAPLRARQLSMLLNPLGTLGLAAIAAGAFAGFAQRRLGDGIQVSVEDVGRFSSQQIAELVQFVGQVSPQSLQTIARTFSSSALYASALGASTAWLLSRKLMSGEWVGDLASGWANDWASDWASGWASDWAATPGAQQAPRNLPSA